MIGGETKELIYWTNRLRCTKTCLASVFLETRRGIRRQTRALFLDRQEDRHVQMGRVFESARRMHKKDRRTLLDALRHSSTEGLADVRCTEEEDVVK